jgi:hypothetical protein
MSWLSDVVDNVVSNFNDSPMAFIANPTLAIQAEEARYAADLVIAKNSNSLLGPRNGRTGGEKSEDWYKRTKRAEIGALDIDPGSKDELLAMINTHSFGEIGTALALATAHEGKYASRYKGYLKQKEAIDHPGQAQLMSTQSTGGGLLTPAPTQSLLLPNGGR